MFRKKKKKILREIKLLPQHRDATSNQSVDSSCNRVQENLLGRTIERSSRLFEKKKKTVINNVLLESSLSMNILGLRVKFACTRGFFSNFSSDNQQKYPSRMIEEGRDLSSYSSRIGIYTGGYSRSQKSSHCYLSLIRKIYPLQRQICFSKKNVPSNFHHSIHVFEKDFLQR